MAFLFSAADFHRCNKALSDKGQDVTPCGWYQRVYKTLCPMSWVRTASELISLLQAWYTDFFFLYSWSLSFHMAVICSLMMNMKQMLCCVRMICLMSPAGLQVGRTNRGWQFPWEDLKRPTGWHCGTRQPSSGYCYLHMYLCSVPIRTFLHQITTPTLMFLCINT